MNTTPPEEREEFQLPGLRQFIEGLANVYRVGELVRGLKQENKKLQQELSRLEARVEFQAGQLKQLGDFITMSLRNQIEPRVERATERALEPPAARKEKPKDQR